MQTLIKGLNDSLYKQYGNTITTSFSNLGHSYSGLSGKSSEDFGRGKPFITYLNVYSNNVVNENDYQYVLINDGEKQNIVQYGDVLFTLSSETPEEVGVGSVYLGIDNNRSFARARVVVRLFRPCCCLSSNVRGQDNGRVWVYS